MSKRSSVLVSRFYYEIGIITLITAGLWVAQSVFSAIVKPTTGKVDAAIMAPLNPAIDQATVASMAARTQLSLTAPDLVDTLLATMAASPTPTPRPSATPTASAAATSSPSASLAP